MSKKKRRVRGKLPLKNQKRMRIILNLMGKCNRQMRILTKTKKSLRRETIVVKTTGIKEGITTNMRIGLRCC